MLIASGLMFPLSVGISTFIKADWKLEGNPLGQLGIFLNIAQIIYFPILFWAIGKSPEEAVMIFAIITGAHFFPYRWFYQAIPYTVMAPITSLAIMIVGLNVDTHQLLLVPLSLIVLIFFLLTWLHIDLKKKVQTEDVG